MTKSLSLKLNIVLLISLIISLATYYLKIFIPTLENNLIIIVGLLATVPVIISAINALIHKKVTVDLLASIDITASLINHEWASVAFINLMITSARIFGDYTEGRAQSAIKSLPKLLPEKVKLKKGDSIEIVPIDKLKINI